MIYPGDRVIETSLCANQGDEGTVYRGERKERRSFGYLLVRWDDGMHTSLTGGSKLVSEIEPEELDRLREISRKRIRLNPQASPATNNGGDIMQVFYFRDDPATGDVKCEVVIAPTEAEAWRIVGEGMDEGYVEEHVELLDCHPVKPGKLVSYSDSEDGCEVEMPQVGLNLP